MDPSDRLVAIAAGDLRGAVEREVKRVVRENRGHQPKAIKVGVKELLAAGLITPRDAEYLIAISDTVFAAIRQKIDGTEAAFTVRRIYQEMIAKPGSSSTALAIASVTSGAFVPNNPPHLPEGAVALFNPIPHDEHGSIVAGAVVGGVIGGTIGGGGGAIVGAVIGGIIGGVVGACTDDDAGSPDAGGSDSPA
jgi:hypothetical protein